MKGSLLLVASLVIQVQAASELLEPIAKCKTCGIITLDMLTSKQRNQRDYYVTTCKQCRKHNVCDFSYWAYDFSN